MSSNMTSASGEASASISSDNYTAGHTSRAKRKRNLPGNPDPDAEVIALSPNSLMATNRFVCQVCNKGFQRDQNLQLHRRGHNLPWKLRQRSGKESRKRVYICPESSCVHHDPSRALGDLTGIKKHFSRKHGEKKWKCDKCCKTYAVQSDWKAHSKTCGTREYRCDCGALFSRRDSFITHRAFCDALAQEKAIMTLPEGGANDMKSSSSCAAASPLGVMSSDENGRVPLWLGTDPSNPMDMGIASSFLTTQPPKAMLPPSDYDDTAGQNPSLSGLWPLTLSPAMGSLYSSLFNSGSSQVPVNLNAMDLSSRMPSTMDLEQGATNWSSTRLPSALMESNDITRSLPSMYGHHCSESISNISQMSATALLQKAAQMGAKASSSSALYSGSMERQSQKQHRGEILGFVHSHSEAMDTTSRDTSEEANAGLQDMMKSCVGSSNAEKGFDGMLQQRLVTFGENNIAASEAYGGLIESLAPRNIDIAPVPQHKSLLQVDKNVNPAVEECEGVTRDFLGVSRLSSAGRGGGMRLVLNMGPYNNLLD